MTTSLDDDDPWSVPWTGDCPVQRQDYPLDLWRYEFETATGYLSQWPVANFQIDGGDDRVEIAILDTAGTDVANSPAAHGPLMAAIARDAGVGSIPGFGEDPRSPTIKTFAALPRQSATSAPDPITGGQIGYASDVAVAIDRALKDWHEGGAKRLVLNLSLAWPTDSVNPGQVDPVFDMLQRARCDGALIIAAAGNLNPLADASTRFAPAVWEEKPAFDSCPSQAGATADAPLVHAVWAVDADHQPLPTTPPLMRSRLSAMGYQAWAEVPGRTLPPMSGTSVSAAVVSGIAGAVWSTNLDGYDADQVMGYILAGATANAGMGPITLNPTQGMVPHVATTCGALREALELGPDVCTSSAPYTITPPSVTPIVVSSEDREQTMCQQAADQTFTIFASGTPPHDLIAQPQPNSYPCPACYLDFSLGDAVAHLQLTTEYDPNNLVGTSITLYGAQEEVEIHYYTATEMALTNSTQAFSDAALTKVGDTISSAGSDPTSAWVEIYYNENGDTVSSGNTLVLMP